ncbi:RdRP-domain-containing protein [Xylaria venustula]|nr:RdRP-domain-containing protein [Xylaria venustula]
MPKAKPESYEQKIQDISLSDHQWRYEGLALGGLPGPHFLDENGYIKSISLISDNISSYIVFKLHKFNPNLAAEGLRPSQMLASDKSGDCKKWARKESTDYVTKLLRTGIEIKSVNYHFYGYSNSQLKSQNFLLLAATKEDISRRIEAFGDFDRIKKVAKKVKRICLLFSEAQAATVVNPGQCEDISDIENDNYVITDGCGLISPRFAQELSRRLDLPYVYGYLNDEVVILLNSWGISPETLLRKQAEHFQFLEEASKDPRVAFRFLCFINKFELAEQVLMESLETVRPQILKLVKDEKGKMLNKRDTRKCRIPIPKSRLLFGVCDELGVLKEGECHAKITTDENGLPQTLKNAHVLVTRNPCLHPGDLQKFKLVYCPELSHLVDCIAFPVCGRRPAADMMSGGDLDGDAFFVCWDEDIMPSKLSEPALYPAGREVLIFKHISDEDCLKFFSQYSSASLGRTKNLHLDWVKVKGPMAPECQELNRLFSQCVDGNHVKVPARLENAPNSSSDNPPFILDVLHESATNSADRMIYDMENFEGYTYDAIELLLSRDGIAVSEFELIQLTFKWCRQNNMPLHHLLHFFDFNNLTSDEKIWTVSQLPVTPGVPSLIMNALCSSDLLNNEEVSMFALDNSGTRWKRIYSSRDRMATLLEEVGRFLELFHKKFIILRVDERLTIALYIPQKVEMSQDYLVGDHLFEGERRNTWIYIRRGGSDDSSYRNATSIGGRRRQRQTSLDCGLNFEFVASIALDKFSRNLLGHIGRVGNNGVLAAEIYVITNRDVHSMQTLDLWLKYIDTKERMPLFDEEPREYSAPSSTNLGFLVRIVNEDILALAEVESLDDMSYIFTWFGERNAKDLLIKSVAYLLDKIGEPESTALAPAVILDAMSLSLDRNPCISVCFAQTGNWNELPEELADKVENRSLDILRKFSLSANDAQELLLRPLRNVLSQIHCLSSNTFSELVELAALAVHSPGLALGILLEWFEPESTRLLHGVDPAIAISLTRNLIGIALDHIG